MPDERREHEDRECTDHAPETRAPHYRLHVTGLRLDRKRRSLRVGRHGIAAAYLWVESAFTSQGPSVESGLDEGGGFVEERAHHTGPVALARVVQHVHVRAIGLVRVDLLAKQVLDYLDLAFARPC